MKKIIHYIICCLLLIVFAGSRALAGNDIIVAKDGSGNFTSIQDAVNSLAKNVRTQRVIIVKKGTYNEKIFLDNSFVTLKGEDKLNTRVVISESRDIFRCDHNDDWGVATINIKGTDINLENLTFINEYGLHAKEQTIPCAADSITGQKKVKRDGHQMVLRSFAASRLTAKNCIFKSCGGDPVSPWNGEDGMYYFKDCTIEGGVDLYCPRGWSLADNCQFICHSKEAGIWHDGSKNQSSKSVFFNCRFTGDKGFKLGRYHRDAQFYLLGCSFSKQMADAAIYQKEATPPNIIQWGRRVYFYDCHKDGGDYEWHKDNLPAPLGINDITAAWAYDYKWNPVDVKQRAGMDTLPPENTAGKVATFDTVAENMLLYQRANGGWPKQFEKEKIEYRRMLLPAELSELRKGFEEGIDATIDNNATTKEIKYLVKVFKQTGDKRFLVAAEKGVDYLLKAQYLNGGWPQFYPDVSSYRSQITFNDNAMINVMVVLQDVVEGNHDLDAIGAGYVDRCALALQRGIGCILKTQVLQNGKPTAWCAQYDAKTLQPVKARAYELPSLSGQESVGILRYLMQFENPGKELIAAIEGGIAWFEKVKITGYKFKEIDNPGTPTGKDKALVPQEGNITWARFYELDTNEPFFCGRDGVKKKKLEDVEFERRVGYQWYNEAPLKLMNTEYPKWKAKWNP